MATERGHKADLAQGSIAAQRNGFTLWQGRDIHDTTRGGQKVTRRGVWLLTRDDAPDTIWWDAKSEAAARAWFDRKAG